MSSNPSHKHPLSRKGTSQAERFPLPLRKDYVKIDERTFTDLIAQTAELSDYFHFYEQSAHVPQGTWKNFFVDIYDFNTKQVKISRLEELEAKSIISPHLGLLLGFIKLLQHSIDQLNGLGEQHLMFFYEKMLRVKRKNAIAPQVTLIGELHKDFEQVLIPKDTIFKAGKNLLGEEQYYKTEIDYILNQAKVTALKNVNFLNTKITQRDIANSADGQGQELQDLPKSWSAFGEETDRNTEIGFCIASPFFGINEGERKIIMILPNVDLREFDTYISVEKGWHRLQWENSAANTYKTLINASFPKIVPANVKEHQLQFDSIQPLIKIIVKDANPSIYLKYRNVIASITIKIEFETIRSIDVKNELGKIDISKPFQPFGNNPNLGTSEVYIGHPFLFNKYTKLMVYNGTNVITNSTYYLNAGIWESTPFSNYDPNYDKEYTATTKNNYIKIKGTSVNSTSKEITITVNTLSESAKKYTISTPTNTNAYWADLYVKAVTEINQSHSEVFTFYHLHPFEMYPRYPVQKLLPHYPIQSLFFIGIDDLKYGQSLALHFEILEGSGDSSLFPPPIEWYIAGEYEISPLNKNEIVQDTTLRLLQSGNITFAISKQHFNRYKQGPQNRIWLVAACDSDYKALPQMLDVSAQAFNVNYIMGIDAYVEDILPERIKKPAVAISGLKKVSQPFNSFAGRSKESLEQYVLRSSERLRHKGAAISIFDYERLLLEEFSYLYKVKCIPHSTTTSQRVPGKVLIIVVPQLKKDNSQVDLQPKVSVGKLESMKQFLEKRISPFVKVEIRNPQYREIKVEVNVKYKEPYHADKEYYNNILNSRLQSFIAPWIVNKKEVEFNQADYKSKYINFIEEQEFVDNITFFNLYVDNVRIENQIESLREDVVFTSVKDHMIKNDDLC